jgi:diphthamide synthase subunit DPH2
MHFEGARIVRVIEDAEQQTLTFEVSYPLTEGASDFPRRQLIFQGCSRYLIDEGGMLGAPVIRRVEIVEKEAHRMKIRMHTDHGVREVTCFPEVLNERL